MDFNHPNGDYWYWHSSPDYIYSAVIYYPVNGYSAALTNRVDGYHQRPVLNNYNR